MRDQAVPTPVVRRLSLYLREMERLAQDGVAQISSLQLSQRLCLTAAQVRKDLAFFGQFGRPGVGYKVSDLMAELRRILGTDKMWNVVLVGVGGLGGAILRHGRFKLRGFDVVAAVDNSPSKVGRQIGSVTISHTDDLARIVRENDVKMAIVTVPAQSAQGVVDALHAAGVTGILNFAPVSLSPQDGLAIEPVDIAAFLEQLSFQAGAAEAGQP